MHRKISALVVNNHVAIIILSAPRVDTHTFQTKADLNRSCRKVN